jgi:hypothetical protein
MQRELYIFMSCCYNADEHHSTNVGIFFKFDKIGTCGKDSNEAEIYSKEFWTANLMFNLDLFTFLHDN